MPAFFRKILGLALALGLALPFAAVAQAASIDFKVRSYSRYAVEIAFFSQNRKHSWPGPGRVWVIKDYKVANYNLSCVPGEKICYGASVKGNAKTYWGTGSTNKFTCAKCCYTCGSGDTPVINLNE